MARIPSHRTFYRVLHRIADGKVGAMERAFLRSIRVAVSQVDREMLTIALAQHNVQGAFDAINLNGQLSAQLRADYARALRQVFRATAVSVAADANMDISIVNPRVLRWAERRAGELVTEINRDQRTMLRPIIARGERRGWTVLETAREIRPRIGLTWRLQEAVENFRDTLTLEGRTEADILTRVNRYAQQLRQYRATMIARTESIRAANASQSEQWRAAAERGDINANEVRRTWIVTPDDVLCELCAAIPDLNPDGVGLDEPFQTDEGEVDEPPLHPHCRCAQALVWNQAEAQEAA